MLRLKSFAFKATLLLLFAFSVNATFSQTIAITQPNGGENINSCTSYTIMWTKTGTLSNYYNIDYSIDGGITWATVATNYNTTGTSYVWTVPNVGSTTARVRVRDAQNTSISDISNANFNINAVKLLTPNGGNTLTAGSSYTITWSDGQNSSNYYTIRYSTNNGSSWTTIASNISGFSYNWTVPNTPSTSCLVVVFDYNNNSSCRLDNSDALFTIQMGLPILTAPNGGEVIGSGCHQYITWQPSSFASNANVKMEYRTSSSGNWILIGTTSASSGSYGWYTPYGLNSTTCMVRISDNNNANLFDISNNNFSIIPQITITTPNGGQNFEGCYAYPITWNKTSLSCLGTTYLEYSTDNGTTWNYITWVSDNGLASQTYNWTVPNPINSSLCLIRVSNNSSNNQFFDVSNATFTIVPNNDITLTSPNGGNNLMAGTTHNITWTGNGTSGTYTVRYSTNNGNNWTTIVSNYSGTSYNWTIPNTASTTCLVQVYDQNASCKYDNSDAVFTISMGLPILTAPNGGEVIGSGCHQYITWQPSSFASNANVKMEYRTSSSGNWILIGTTSASSGSYGWYTPYGLNSTTCMVRISDNNNANLFDISNNNFSIIPQITITTPNGGQNFEGCYAYPITWNKTSLSCLGTTYLEYSTDNGTTWNYITWVSDNGLASQTYNWTVPNPINSSLCLIRVSNNSSNNQFFDVSNATFTIVPNNDITLTSPNGGNNLMAGTTHNITWTGNGTSGTYTVRYSTNNGNNWTTIVSNYSGTSYNWTIPNTASTTCLVQVYDQNASCKYDNSDAVFTISMGLPILTAPNGGEVIGSGCHQYITWQPSSFASNANVKMEYRTSSSGNWILIGTTSANSGNYGWYTPYGLNSTTCMVRISDNNNANLFDISNNNFSIIPQITITTPNGGQNFEGCYAYPITWNKTSLSCLGTTYLEYSTDNGTTWNYITWVSDNGLASQTYNWTVPNPINSSLCLIRVSNNSSNNQFFDVSNATFTIVPNNDITLTSPNGGNNLMAGTTHNITWTGNGTSGTYTVRYSTNNGNNWTTIVSNYSGTSYNWTIPNTASTTCLVQVYDQNASCKYDNSDAVFTISMGLPILTAPNGGEVIGSGCHQYITWQPSSFASNANVKMEYRTSSSGNWILIGTTSANSGNYGWYTPYGLNSTTCMVRISDNNNANLFDISNNNFSIIPQITITTPNGGQNFEGCYAYPITWNKTSLSCLGTTYLEYSTDNGTTWNYITWVSDNGLASQTYNWTVPNPINSSLCLIRVSNNSSNNQFFDVSNATFTIVPNNDITLTSPNGGNNLMAGTTHNITWTGNGTSGTYTVRYSTNNGNNWTTIVSNYSGTSYNWTIPNTASTTCLVQVYDQNASCKYDNSDAVFTISMGLPILTAPNGGEVIGSGCHQYITWQPSSFASNANVKMEYRTSSSGNWILIGTTSANSGNYGWYTPYGLNSTTCMVRISDNNNANLFDISNNNFSIIPQITITTPNGGQNFEGCYAYPITWNKTSLSCLGTTYLEYSTDNGTTWNYITWVSDNGLASQTYNWTVPNPINSSLCLIRVSNNSSNNQFFDVSNATFTIVPNNDITLTSPNGGNNLMAGTTHNITWTGNGTSGTYTVRYSTNNGNNWTTIVSNYSGTSYNWTIPNTASTTCLVQVYDQNASCKYDNSDAVFTISVGGPLLTSPNGGEIWWAGTSQNITWDKNSIAVGTNVKLEYTTNNGSTWNLITASTSNDGSESWFVANANSTQCLVKITSLQNNLTDVSNTVFTIKPAVTITSPNGSQSGILWGGCSNTSITFDRSTGFTNYMIEYSMNNGNTWTTIINNWSTSANPANYSWNIPNIYGTQCLVRVTPVGYATYSDQSDNVFTIVQPVIITQPNTNTTLTIGSTYSITWTNNANSSVYDIFYSTNGGSTWTTIVTAYTTTTNNYSWTVPNTPSTNCLVKVRDNLNNCKEDVSDVPFTIGTGGGGNQTCNLYTSTDVPKNIISNQTAISTITIPATGTVTDVNVKNLGITHTYTGDLTVKLKKATTSVTVLSALCSSNDNMLINFDDESANTYSSIPCPATNNGTYKPLNSLTPFDGQAVNGAWTLEVTDGSSGDDGALTSWGLEVCYTTQPSSTCQTFASTDVPKSIPSNQTIVSNLPVNITGTITDVNVKNLNIAHTYTGDLTVKLKKATTSVTLLSSLCSGNDNMLINFDDESTNAYSSIPCPATNNGTYKPQNSLTSFDGLQMNGTWTLEVIDGASGDEGTLNTWSVEICYQTGGGRTETVTYVIENNTVKEVKGTELNAKVYPNPFTNTLQVVVDEKEETKNLIRITNILGEVVYEKQLFVNSELINTSDFDNGIYIITIINGNKSYQSKLVKSE